MDTVNVDAIVRYVADLQQSNGSFYGDKWGEVDTRFSFAAVACLSLLVSLDKMFICIFSLASVFFHGMFKAVRADA